MAAFNPPHPGEFITEIYLEPKGIRAGVLAMELGVSASTLRRILECRSRVTREMAIRLSKAVGRSPESWLALQNHHDLWLARQIVD